MKWCFIVVVTILFAVNGLMFFLLKKQTSTIDKIEIKAKILQQCNLQLQEMINLKTEFEDSVFPKDSVCFTADLSGYYTIDYFITDHKTLCVFFPNSVCNPCLDSINEISQ